MKDFFYAYILVSQAKETIHYTGITRDLEQRLLEHNRGACPHTSQHRPLHSNLRAKRVHSKIFEKPIRSGICSPSSLMFPLERSKKSEGCHAGAERRRTGYARPDSLGAPNYGLADHFNFRFSILDLRLSMLCNESLTSV